MPREAPEGIVFSSTEGTIDFGDVLADKYEDSEVVGLSKSQIETIDLLSEGLIAGLKSGYYIYSGNLGEVGWRTATFSGYQFPAGFTGVGFLHSIYWNEIPVLNDDALFNFQNINVRQTFGKANGEVIQVLSPYQTVSRTISERLRAGANNAKVYRILNKDCHAVVVNVKFPTLSKINDIEGDLGNGDIWRTTVRYNIFYRPVFSIKPSPEFVLGKHEDVFGKIITSNGYIRTTRIDFSTNVWDDPDFIGWEIKVQRDTPESTTSLLQNQSYIESLTEIQGNIYTFPNSAMVRSLFDAEYFSSIPERAFHTDGIKVKIPGNYDPVLRTYNTTGFATSNSGWNGEFATGKHYTNNPVWCYYDLLTNKRYGLGRYVNPEFVSKFELYDIAKYCDTLVYDGFGGLEPRFTINTWITSREEAYKVVNDMASVFRGLTYYANGSIFTIQDRKRDENELKTTTIFANANVEDGNFNYSTTSRRTRNTIAIVRYNDPKNFYKPAVEYIENFDGIRKYGIKEVELTAFGCASRGQAIRLGRWALLSDNLEPETINFIGGLEAIYLRPGDIFKVHDTNRKTKRYGGRVSRLNNINNTGTELYLDYKTDLEPNVEYNLSLLTPSYNYDSTQVSGLNSTDSSSIRKSFVQLFTFSGFQAQNSGNRTILNLYSGLDYNNYYCSGNPVWTIELSERYAGFTGARYFANTSYDYYRVINVKENDIHKYEIEGLQYNPQKYIEIESGLLFSRDIVNTYKIPASPYGLNFNVYNINQNSKIINYSFLSDDLTNTDTFKVYAKLNNFNGNGVPDSQYLINVLPSEITTENYIPTETGTYHFRVYASNDKQGILSPSFASGATTIYSFNPIRDIIISTLEVQNITGIYSGNSVNNNLTIVTDNDANPIFTWQAGSNNTFLSTGDIKYRATIREWSAQNSRIPTDNILYQVTGLTDTTWTFTLDNNLASVSGPVRNYQVVVEAHDSEGNTSAGNKIDVFPDEGWNIFSDGYDILSIQNPRQTGIELSLNVDTQPTLNTGFFKNTGEYKSFQYITDNGDVSIEFTSGQFDADLVGGFMYVSSGRFPKYETQLRSGEWATSVTKTNFEFNPLNGQIYRTNAAYNVRMLPFAYISLSFYDEIDQVLLDKGVDISTGLYLSDNAVIEKNTIGALINGDANIFVGRVTGLATSSSDPIITENTSPGYQVLGYTLGDSYTNIVYVKGGVTSNITSGQILPSPYLPTVTGVYIYLNDYVDDSLFISINDFPIKSDNNPYGGDVLEYDIYNNAIGFGVYLKRNDIIKVKTRDNFGNPTSTETWTGVVGYSDGTSQVYYGGKKSVTVGTWTPPIYTDNGYFIVGQEQNYPY